MANYEVPPNEPDTAEIAMVVDRTAQAHGVGTLLLEHLASMGRSRGLLQFVAEVLAENHRMIKVFVDAGLGYRASHDGPERQMVISLEPDEHYLDAIGERERVADVASLAGVLRPRSVVVIGAGRKPGSVGHAVLRNLNMAGFTGGLFVVNPHADQIAGLRSWPSVADLPEVPDLAVVCVPAAAVPDTVEQCGELGIRAAVVISAGLSGTELGGRMLDAVRRHGIRLVGPNRIGVVNTDLAVLYLESFGNPRKFSRVARALARTKPVLAVRPAGSEVA